MPCKLFTIFLPVRNGGEHLKQCIASILAQSSADSFDLRVLDNASTDGTAEWLATLNDSRLQLFPAVRPLSIEENWARIKDISKNEFTTIIGHDDLLDDTFLEVVIRLISRYPDAGIYLTHFRLIDLQGRLLRPCRPMPASETAAEFLASRLAETRDSYGTGYVFRSADYDRVGGIPSFPRLIYADDALWLQMMLLNRAPRATSPEECFSYRFHSESAARTTAISDHLTALETFWGLLETLASKDNEVARVLARYGPGYLALFGRGCRRSVLENRVLRGSADDPLIDERLERLLTRAGVTIADLQTGPGNRGLAVLEWAGRTQLKRTAGRLLFSLRNMALDQFQQ